MKKLFFKASAAVLAVIIICTGCSCSNVVSLVGTGEYSSDSGDSLAVGGNNSENISSGNSFDSSDENSENSGDSSSDDNSHDNSSSADSSSDTSSDNSSSSSSTGNSSSVSSSTNTSSSGSTTTSKPSSSSTTTSKPSSSSTTASKPSSSSTTASKPSSSSTTASKPSSSSTTTSKPSSSSTSNANDGITFSWKIGNTWVEGGNKCGTAELTIKNNSGSNLNSWKVTFNVPNGFKITSSWEGKYDVNGTKATVSNLEYNGSIPSGGSRTTGFNFSCPTTFNPSDKLEFNGSPASASGSGNQGNNNNNNNNNTAAPSGTVSQLLARDPKAKQGDDWLHTDGNKILDKNGKQVWLTGVNWFGYNTGTNTFDGLWNSCMRTSVKGIADHGFNLIRVPISAELLNQWSRGEYPKANYNSALNPEMNNMNSLQIFDYFLKLAEENGIKVMPDIHCAETNAMGHNVNLWYTSKVTVNDYYHALEWLADRYKNNDTIIAIDIKNEPHGKPNEGSNAAIWNNSTAANNWKYVAETAAKKILAKNPNVLIMVEGTEIYSKKNGSYTSTNSADYYFNWWGGNLRGVRDYPINLGKYQNKLVYSPHDYGPAVYKQPWFFSGYNYNTLIRDCWQDNWLYIHKNNTAPLLIGEWGGFMTEPNLTWMTCMRRLIKEYHLNHTFWCYNANSGDTGGLVLDDFTTWDTQKYNFVKEVLWQEGGKFVGLDHSIPLGANGITLTAAKGL